MEKWGGATNERPTQGVAATMITARPAKTQESRKGDEIFPRGGRADQATNNRKANGLAETGPAYMPFPNSRASAIDLTEGRGGLPQPFPELPGLQDLGVGAP